ncbi:MAG: hypothetical protein KDB27_12015 [Planctomycetales bacterium]|nr:hypothetical protein [Planctomycetales bacterium]
MRTKHFIVALIGTFAVAIAADRVVAQNTKLSEAELIAILASDAPKSEKAITCKHLAVHGTENAVPELAKLLPDAELTSWARTALEAIPDRAATTALRAGLDTTEGRSLVGVINSVGLKRDTEAVEKLAQLLTVADHDVQDAAAVALGRIANIDARLHLLALLKNDSAEARASAAEGLILIAEQLAELSDAEGAAQAYDSVSKADVPKQRQLEGIRGVIVTRKSIPLLTAELNNSDHDHFQLGLHTARELSEDQDVTDALVAALDTVDESRQSLIVTSLADREPSSVLPTILKVASAGSTSIRASVMDVLGRIGDKSCLETILNATADSETAVAEAAAAALTTLPDPSVDDEIVSRLDAATDATRLALLRAIGARRIHATEKLTAMMAASSQSIREAALAALGTTVTPGELSILIDRVVANDRDQTAAHKALLTAAVRMPDREACAAELSSSLSTASIDAQCALIEILGQVGGATALQTVGKKAGPDQDSKLRDAASQALGRWMTPDAAPVLLELAKPIARSKYDVRALRGYLRIARQMKIPMAQRADMCRNALEVAGRDEERQLAISVLKIHASLDSLAVAIEATKNESVAADAKDAVQVIISKIGNDIPNLEQILRDGGFRTANIEISKATYGAGEQQKDVTKVVKDSVGKLPIVTLPSPSFNQAFGGDPAPGVQKTLVIEYSIDGQAGTASFQENAAIVLPTQGTQ